MPCSPQTYRIRIGIYNAGRNIYKKTDSNHSSSSKKTLQKKKLIVTLIIANYYMLVLLGPVLLHPYITSETCWQPKPGSFTIPYTDQYQFSADTGPYQLAGQSDVWDPGDTVSTPVLITNTDRNKLAHTTNGNRGQRGKGINCVYWNKGPSFLCNKQLDIETIVERHKPHVLGLGEANFRHDHDLEDVQLPGYTLHLDSSVNNPNLGMARVAVYTHNALRVKRRPDLEDDSIAAIWLECGLPNQQGVIICVGYRQWRLVGQTDNTSASVQEQFARWSIFLDKWEAALTENKEVLVTLDANLDHLTWRMTDNLPSHHSSIRLKCLIDALFDRIFPLGVTQLVRGATRMERGMPRTGLYHFYSNKPDKLSSVETFFYWSF